MNSVSMELGFDLNLSNSIGATVVAQNRHVAPRRYPVPANAVTISPVFLQQDAWNPVNGGVVAYDS